MGFRVRHGYHLRPADGFSSCGDLPVAFGRDDDWVFAVIDALGHGSDAERAAKACARALVAHGPGDLDSLFQAADRALSGLRGVVLSAVRVQGSSVLFSGIGNVDLYGPPGVPRPAPVAGTVGRGVKRHRRHPLPVQPGQRWVLASDGLIARAMGPALAAARALTPQPAAVQLISQAARSHDDACILVMDFE